MTTDVRSITRPHKKLLTLYVLSSLALGPCFFVALLPMYFKYVTLRYRFDEEGIGMSWGVLWRREIYLTYARIQDIHLSRGLIERWLGLATIEVQTASGKATAEMSIVGVTAFAELRDFLYGRMRGARLGEGGVVANVPAAPGATAENFGPPGQTDQVGELLIEIRDGLREIRSALDTRGRS